MPLLMLGLEPSTAVPPPAGLRLAEGASAEVVPGPIAPAQVLRAVRPAPLAARAVASGPWIPPPVDPAVAASSLMSVAGLLVPRLLSVEEFPDAMNPQVYPKWNDVGSGSFTIPNSVVGWTMGDEVHFSLGGRRVFSGFIAKAKQALVSPNEEAGQLTDVQVTGLLGEWADAIVYPDFGASEPPVLGEPLQEARTFDWSSNGIPPDSALTSSESVEPLAAIENGFQLPHTWPDATARWMWDRSFFSTSVPVGDVYFRYGFGPDTPMRVQVWMAAYDYAEAWLDGVPILKCDQAGVPQFVELDLGAHFHLACVKATNYGGRAGVLFAVREVVVGTFGETRLVSGPDDVGRYPWLCSGYQPPIIFSVGEVLERLLLEAQARYVHGMRDWSFSFTATHDSAGNPWPDGEAITVAVGASYLDVVRQLNESLIDFVPAPGGRVLHAYVKGNGTGDTVPLPWAVAESILSGDGEVTL